MLRRNNLSGTGKHMNTCEIHGGKIEDGEECFLCHAEAEASRQEAMAEDAAHRAKVEREQEQEECPHDETDHFVCLSCGKELDVGEAIDRAMDYLEDR